MFLPPPQAPQDLFRRIQCFGQLPEYENYLKGFHSLPAPAESGWDLTWPFPSPPLLDFDQALPGYVGPYLQSLTPLGGGGARRSAPWPPPGREKKTKQPLPSKTSDPACQTYEELPEPQSDPEGAARVLISRLLGDPGRISALGLCHPPPDENHDILRLERLTVYAVLREDRRLRYHVDKRRFFRTLAGGAVSDLLSLARASQILRQGQSRLKQWLALLPYQRHLSTPAPPRPPKRATPAVAPPTAAPSAVPVESTSTRVATPAPPPAAPSPSAIPSAAPQAVPPVAPMASPQPVPPPAAEPPAPPAPVTAPAGPAVPFNLKIHRYWDLAAGDYCQVAEVLLEGQGCDESPLLNSQKSPTFLVTENLPLGATIKVTVTWANGTKRSWEERLSLSSGIATEVFSPEG